MHEEFDSKSSTWIKSPENTDKLFSALKLSLELDNDAYWEWLVNEDKIVNYNMTWLDLYEMKPESISAQFDAKILESDKDDVWSTIQEGLLTDDSYTHEFHIFNKDNSRLKKIRNTGLVVERDTEGNPFRVLGISKDITEYDRVNEELEQRQKFADAVTTSSAAGIYIFDLQKRENVYSNVRAGEILGYTPQILKEMPSAEFMERFHPDDIEDIVAHIGSIVQNKVPSKIKYRFKHSDGHYVTCLSVDSPFEYDSQGEVKTYIGSFIDISELQQKEEELLEAKEQAELINQKLNLSLDSDKAAIWEWDIKNDETISYNKHWEGLFQFKSTKGVAKEFDKRVHSDDIDAVWAAFREHMEKGTDRYSATYRYYQPDGKSIKWIKNSGKVTEVGLNGEALKMVGFAIDVTDLQESKEQLLVAKEQAEIANNQKNLFLSNLSHEIRTPLNAIVGFANLLRKPLLDQKKKDLYVQQVNHNSKQLLVLLDDIADLTKIESGELQFKEECIELSQIANQVFEAFEERLNDHKSLQIELLNMNKDGKEVEFLADPTRIKQVLNNLVDNAIKYSDEGTILLSYSSNAESIRFEVKDEGIGIEQNDLKRIFTRFEQVADDEFSTKGSGLGLAISKGIIDKMGGTITVSSEKGEGSTFTISFPRRTKVCNGVKEVEFKIRPEVGAKKVLIADDSPSVLLYYQVILEDKGIEFMLAHDGQEAVQLYNQNSGFDMVFLDIKMPKLNGIEVMKKIRMRDKKVPIVAQTAFALNDEVKKLKEQGFNDCINKPIEEHNLLKLLGHNG